jgi:hypothetical protein
MRRLTLALALIALAVPSATASTDRAEPASVPATHGCHHGAGLPANVGLDV